MEAVLCLHLVKQIVRRTYWRLSKGSVQNWHAIQVNYLLYLDPNLQCHATRAKRCMPGGVFNIDSRS